MGAAKDIGDTLMSGGTTGRIGRQYIHAACRIFIGIRLIIVATKEWDLYMSPYDAKSRCLMRIQ